LPKDVTGVRSLIKFLLQLLIRLLGIWHVLLAISLLIGFNLNPSPGVGAFNWLFLSLIVCAGLQYWAGIGIIFSAILLSIISIGRDMDAVFFLTLLSPSVFISVWLFDARRNHKTEP